MNDSPNRCGGRGALMEAAQQFARDSIIDVDQGFRVRIITMDREVSINLIRKPGGEIQEVQDTNGEAWQGVRPDDVPRHWKFFSAREQQIVSHIRENGWTTAETFFRRWPKNTKETRTILTGLVARRVLASGRQGYNLDRDP